VVALQGQMTFDSGRLSDIVRMIDVWSSRNQAQFTVEKGLDGLEGGIRYLLGELEISRSNFISQSTAKGERN
jgi:hypothetical protein